MPQPQRPACPIAHHASQAPLVDRMYRRHRPPEHTPSMYLLHGPNTVHGHKKPIEQRAASYDQNPCLNAARIVLTIAVLVRATRLSARSPSIPQSPCEIGYGHWATWDVPGPASCAARPPSSPITSGVDACLCVARHSAGAHEAHRPYHMS